MLLLLLLPLLLLLLLLQQLLFFSILDAYHSDEMLSHPRPAIMNKLLRRRFFWPSMSAVVTVTGGDPMTNKDKPRMYSISKAFHDKYVKNATPPTWKEHLKTLRRKEHDPPPKKGVAARMRSAPAGEAPRGSKQETRPQPASARDARALGSRSERAHILISAKTVIDIQCACRSTATGSPFS